MDKARKMNILASKWTITISYKRLITLLGIKTILINTISSIHSIIIL